MPHKRKRKHQDDIVLNENISRHCNTKRAGVADGKTKIDDSPGGHPGQAARNNTFQRRDSSSQHAKRAISKMPLARVTSRNLSQGNDINLVRGCLENKDSSATSLPDEISIKWTSRDPKSKTKGLSSVLEADQALHEKATDGPCPALALLVQPALSKPREEASKEDVHRQAVLAETVLTRLNGLEIINVASQEGTSVPPLKSASTANQGTTIARDNQAVVLVHQESSKEMSYPGSKKQN
jgi:hypothetical protein